jgi:RTX calcium-binding nonapeptide repeat (4 copies)
MLRRVVLLLGGTLLVGVLLLSGVALAENIRGTFGQDDLTGTNQNDRIYGLGAADTIEGRAGNDDCYGGSGADEISCGNVNDRIDSGFGEDIFGAFVCYLRLSMCQAHRPQPSADYLSLLGVTTFGACSILGQQGKEAETGRLGVLRLRHLSRSRLRYVLRAGASRRSSLAFGPRPSSTWGKVDDVRSQLGDEYKKIFDSGGFRFSLIQTRSLRRIFRS